MESDHSDFAYAQWAAFQKVNSVFAEVVCGIYRPGDIVWVQDFHLMLLPAMLRKRVPEMRIGWFLHIPFPSSETFRNLPQRRELLAGVLGADLLGFHIYDYTRHFMSSCTRMLGTPTHRSTDVE